MYKTILEFPKYEISESGEIRNIKTQKKKYVTVNKQGYKYTQFKVAKVVIVRKIHRLVAEYFLPEPKESLVSECLNKYPYKVCVNHIDHNKLNNDVSNLEWCTMKHNNKESWRLGVTPPLKGVLNGRSILTEELVHKLCKAFEGGMRPREAEEVFSVSRSQATKIRAGFAWKHISSQYKIVVNKRLK